MKRRLIAFMIVFAMVFTFMPLNASAAAKTKKMLAYDEVLVTGNTAYCAGTEGIYKVKLSNGKVTGKKLLHKDNFITDMAHYMGMKKKGDYLYVQVSSESMYYSLARINVKTGKYRELICLEDQGLIQYFIKDKKIYCSGEYGKVRKIIMKLNGKSKKKSSVKVVTKTKESNKKGYSIDVREKGSKIITVLVTPKGRYTLGYHKY